MLATLPKAQLREVLDSLGICAFAVDVLPDGGFQYAAFSTRLETLIGADRPIGGAAPEEFLAPEVVAGLHENYRRCVNARICSEYEEVVALPGGRRWWHTVLSPLFGPDGRVVRIMGTTTEISHRRHMERALRRKTADLEAVLDAAPAAIWIAHDPDCHRITGSRVGYEILRMPYGQNPTLTPATDPPPTHFRILKDGIELRPEDLPLQRAARGEEIRDFEEEVVFDDGTSRYVLGNARPLYTASGRVRGAVGAFVDITERKRAETGLRAAKEEAERASAAKTRFLAAASHDLRQPMQSMQMYVELLDRGLTRPEDRRLVHKVQNALTTQRELLDVLLDISRLDAGLVTPQPAAVPLGPVLERLADAFAPLAQAKGLRLKAMATRLAVRSDATLLDRILHNLVANAIRYTGQGGILIGCRYAGKAVRIQVCDTGIGIPAEKIPYIFEEFYQVDNQARDRRRGLGLGLSIVRRLADLLGHRLTVRSVPGRGSVFELAVPAAVPAEAAAAPAEAAPAEAAGQIIVLIDDEPDVLYALTLVLESWGYQVVAASGIAAARARLRTLGDVPALIVADHRLRGATGAEAITTLRREIGMTVPGIILTGDTSPDRLRQAQASGFGLLHKPVHPNALREAVARSVAAEVPASEPG